jgi:hypothetical protein
MLRKAIGPQRVGSYDPLIEAQVARLMPVLNTFQGNPIDMMLRYVKYALRVNPIS